MARAGLIDEEIAKELKIAVSTLYLWQKKYPEFSEALKEGKKVADDKVEQALFRRAVGYEYVETKTIVEVAQGKEEAS
jgi:transposase